VPFLKPTGMDDRSPSPDASGFCCARIAAQVRITSIIRTTGNPAGHVVLRGGRGRSNYDAESIREAEIRLAQAGLPEVLMVDLQPC